jgi:hypothetical protein
MGLFYANKTFFAGCISNGAKLPFICKQVSRSANKIRDDISRFPAAKAGHFGKPIKKSGKTFV